MLNWEYELKKFLVKKFNTLTGGEISTDNISIVEFHAELDLNLLTIRELAYLYAFSIMKEEFEEAKKIADNILKRKHKIILNIDEPNRVGSVDVYKDTKRKQKKPVAHVSLIVKSDGMMIDFEKEEF